MSLTREQVLAKRELPRAVVPVPEWGGEVIVRALTGRERDDFEAGLIGEKRNERNLTNLRARFVAACVVDEAGKTLFDVGDVIALGELSASALDRIFTVGRDLSGLTERDVTELVKH